MCRGRAIIGRSNKKDRLPQHILDRQSKSPALPAGSYVNVTKVNRIKSCENSGPVCSIDNAGGVVNPKKDKKKEDADISPLRDARHKGPLASSSVISIADLLRLVKDKKHPCIHRNRRSGGKQGP